MLPHCLRLGYLSPGFGKEDDADPSVCGREVVVNPSDWGLGSPCEIVLGSFPDHLASVNIEPMKVRLHRRNPILETPSPRHCHPLCWRVLRPWEFVAWTLTDKYRLCTATQRILAWQTAGFRVCDCGVLGFWRLSSSLVEYSTEKT